MRANAKIHRRNNLRNWQAEAMTLFDRIVIMSATKNPAGTGTIGRVEQINLLARVLRTLDSRSWIHRKPYEYNVMKLDERTSLQWISSEGALKVLKEKGYWR